MNDPILPDNDIDVRLARKLGVLIESNRAEWQLRNDLSGNDPFVDMLGQLKTSYQGIKVEHLPDSAASARMWNAIHTATYQSATTPAAQPNKPGARIFSLSPSFYRIAIAASMLVAIAVSWMLFVRTPGPTLMAEANQTLAHFTLEDGSSIALRPHSKLYSVSSNDAELRYKLEGEGFFDVTHNSERTFYVEAGNAQVAVLGTTFNVSARQQEVTVYLQDGRIELKNQQSGQAVILSPGQSGTVDNQQVILHGQPARAEEHMDWLNNEISFAGAPLNAVIEELEFHFGIAIEIPQNRENETISGSIVLEDIPFVLDGLSFVMQGGSFVQTGEHSYRFEEN